jgi:cysteine desulfurase / selenocysteine lyase
MNFQEARKLYPGLKDKVFLDAACVSLIPQTAKQEIENFLQMALECPARDASFHHIAMDTWRQKTVLETAKLFNVEENRIALVESTTHGLNIAASCIPFEENDEILIIDTEFLQVAIPFSKKEEQHQLKIVAVEGSQDKSVDLPMLLEKVSKKTKAICISSVQWCSGYRFSMQELGDFCRERGIWLIVDAVHEAGVLSIDATKRYADFLITGGHKWLNAPFGCGIMILSSRALQLSPTSYGYLALEEPTGGWGAFFQDPTQTPFRQYNYPKTAKQFEISGTSNYPGAIGLRETIKIVNQLSVSKVEEYVLSLGQFLQKELTKLNFKIVSSKDPKHQSAITVFRAFDDPDKDRMLLEKLLDEKIFASIRYTANRGGIRISTHYYNNQEDILKLCHTIKKIIA